MKLTNKTKHDLKNNIIGYAFISPQIIGIVVLVYFGTIFVTAVSFSNWNFYGGLTLKNFKFTGLINYKYVLANDRFISSVITNSFMVLMVPVTAFISLIIGKAISSKYFFERGLRAIYFIPNICNVVAIVMLWSALFHPRLSPVSDIMRTIGITPPEWFSTPWNSRIMIYMLTLWRSLGYYAFIYLGALNAVPKHLYEAADIDGAGAITKFFKITLPVVSPTTFFIIITGVMSAIKEWTSILLLTNGGPGGSTSVFGMLAYRFAFPSGGMDQDLGAASAVTVIMLAIAIVVTLINWKFQDKWVNYDN